MFLTSMQYGIICFFFFFWKICRVKLLTWKLDFVWFLHQMLLNFDTNWIFRYSKVRSKMGKTFQQAFGQPTKACSKAWSIWKRKPNKEKTETWYRFKNSSKFSFERFSYQTIKIIWTILFWKHYTVQCWYSYSYTFIFCL